MGAFNLKNLASKGGGKISQGFARILARNRRFRQDSAVMAHEMGKAFLLLKRGEVAEKPAMGWFLTFFEALSNHRRMSVNFDANCALSAEKRRFASILRERARAGGHTMIPGGDGMSFSELKRKDVVNISDGRKLGKPIDLMLNDSACVQALVVPGRSGGLLGFLKPDREGCVIDWSRVRRIGDDVILVELDPRRDGEA